jgi:hypothetical protein
MIINSSTDIDLDNPPLCECGCGEPVKSQKYGIWSRWCQGHSSRGRNVHKPRIGEAWCNQHKMHPKDCFEIHYPNSVGTNIHWLEERRNHDGKTNT